MAAIAFGPKGERLLAADTNGMARLLDGHTLEPLADREGHRAFCHAAAFDPTGALVATGSDDGHVLIAHAEDLAVQAEYRYEGKGGIDALAFTPDGAVLYAGVGDGTIRRLDAATGEQRDVLAAHERGVPGLALGPDGHLLASVSHDGTLSWWTEGDERPVARTVTVSKKGLYAVALDGEGTWAATAGSDGALRVYRVGEDEPTATLAVSDADVYAVVWHPQEPLLAWSGAEGRAGLVRFVPPPADEDAAER